jgi:GAF domain-containing protein
VYFGAALLSWAVAVVFVEKGIPIGLTLAAAFLIVTTVVTSVYRYLGHVHEEVLKAEATRRAAIMQAHTSLASVMAAQIAASEGCKGDSKDYPHALGISREWLQQIVQAAYQTCQAAFGQETAGVEARVDFEATFMTRSYKDNKITIAAWASREGRMPNSLTRRLTEPDIYDTTITARVYKEQCPSVHIVEDTWDPNADYQETYVGQRERLKSTIVCPVLSVGNRLLGTLVVHCDKRGFFRREEQKYWRDLLSVFSGALALVKLRMDRLRDLSHTGSVPLGHPGDEF